MRRKIRRIRINPKIVISIFAAIIVVLIISYSYIITKNMKKNKFADSMIELSEKNEEPIFCVSGMELFSSANVIDNSIEKNLQSLDIYQYANITLKIDNTKKIKELTKENTIKQLYIDNISLESNSQIGDKSLYYLNPLKVGEDTGLDNCIKTDRIDFDIVYTNEENNKADYSKPTFYTDCSNSITLKYINKDIVKGYKMSKDKTISFDGKILKEAKVAEKDLECRIRFKINIVNNNDDKFSCWMNFSIPINKLYTEGMTIQSTKNIKYDFFAM